MDGIHPTVRTLITTLGSVSCRQRLCRGVECKGRDGVNHHSPNRPCINRVLLGSAFTGLCITPIENQATRQGLGAIGQGRLRAMFIYDLDIGPGLTAPMVPPGEYTIVLKAHGQEMRQSLTILKDPGSKSTDEEINTQFTYGIGFV